MTAADGRDRPIRLLTVCLGNICRSPTAEAALLEAAARAGIEVEVSSAGTGSWHVGEPADPRMRAAAERAGLALAGVAAQVDAAALRSADLVLVMDATNLADVERLAAGDGCTTPIRRFRSFDPEAAGSLDVPDPYDGVEQGFVEVVAMCRRAAATIVEQLAAGVDPADLEGTHDPLSSH